MHELDAANVTTYLVDFGWLPASSATDVQPLAWGVSNLVLRVERPGQSAIVIKQSRPQLRTAIDWFSRCERIYREADVLRAIVPLLPPGTVPRVLFEDRKNYILGLEAIRADHVVWKQRLLNNCLDDTVAESLGTSLGVIHRETAGRPSLLPDAEDWSLFDELRIDPFYRWIARVHPVIEPSVTDLIDEMSRHRVCLVLADFSPKNVLIHADGVSLVDFETGHYGDPAFDLGFFLSHLLLKSLRWRHAMPEWQRLIDTFWKRYQETVDQNSGTPVASAETAVRAVRHLAACLLARIDGKSTVDYLGEPWHPEFVRGLGLSWLQNPPSTLGDALYDFFEKSRLATSSPKL
ncbi:MAG TPA: aminoglycoside phosphotransferase family protein [Planctomicrobium sp.]|nr:aminoglycoside phosphotransferase family protein [Planctomicrobium sp.]